LTLVENSASSEFKILQAKVISDAAVWDPLASSVSQHEGIKNDPNPNPTYLCV
jgi:hypothetical protein